MIWGGCCLVAKLCLTLCDPMDCSPQGSSVHGLFQARTLELVAISFSKLVISDWRKNKGQTPWFKQLRHLHAWSLLGKSCQRLEKALRAYISRWLPALLRLWHCQGPCSPSSCATSVSGPHWHTPESSREASGANSCGQPTCRGEDKITIEPQGQCD